MIRFAKARPLAVLLTLVLLIATLVVVSQPAQATDVTSCPYSQCAYDDTASRYCGANRVAIRSQLTVYSGTVTVTTRSNHGDVPGHSILTYYDDVSVGAGQTLTHTYYTGRSYQTVSNPSGWMDMGYSDYYFDNWSFSTWTFCY